MPKHLLLDLAAKVDKTHSGLGDLFAFSVLSGKAKKTLLVIAPAGTGKSTASDLLLTHFAGSQKIVSMTTAGLTPWQDLLTNFRSLLIVDDLGRLNTSYRRLSTITTLTELVYSHFAEDHTGHQHLSIRDFNGSVIVNCQPVVMRDLIRSGEWEATVADKTIRYYHLRRPTTVSLEPPEVKLDTGGSLEDVKKPNLEDPQIKKLVTRGFFQWGEARSRGHIRDFLMAAAALEKRTQVTVADIEAVSKLIRPLWIEKNVIDKRSLEGDRRMWTNRLYLMTEFITYGTFEVKDLCRNYKVSLSTAEKVMDDNQELWEVIEKNPRRVFAPSDKLKAVMKEVT